MEIRERAGLLPETEVEFVLRDNTVILRKFRVPGPRGRRLVRQLRGKGSKRMTTDQIMTLPRG